MKHRNKAKPFSGIKIGDKAEFEVTIDENMHNNFSKISGDYSPIHCDDIFSEKTKFGRKIGYAFLLTSFLSRLYGEYLPGGSSVCIK
ncbi:MAG: MaoC/PaaZ C-terminal domain-containing protein, partial [Nanoarchaeota archaeon]